MTPTFSEANSAVISPIWKIVNQKENRLSKEQKQVLQSEFLQLLGQVHGCWGKEPGSPACSLRLANLYSAYFTCKGVVKVRWGNTNECTLWPFYTGFWHSYSFSAYSTLTLPQALGQMLRIQRWVRQCLLSQSSGCRNRGWKVFGTLTLIRDVCWGSTGRAWECQRRFPGGGVIWIESWGQIGIKEEGGRTE